VNSKERVLMNRVYDCLAEMGSLMPPNPANIAAISRNLRLSTQAAKSLRTVLSHLNFRDYDEAEEELAEAERLLDRKGIL
jgi:hypothetical protein